MKAACTAFIAVVTLACCPAWGQDDDHRNYLGVSVGSSEAAGTCTDDLTGHRSCTDGAVVRVFGGHRFNQQFALEGGVVGAESGGSALFELSAVGSVPVSERVAFFGRLGGFVTDRASSTSGVTVGVGVRVDLNESFGLRLDWQNLDAGGGSGDFVSLGVYLRF